ncbi:hypothetical protein Hanom_Chr07g00601091 [Helianthus anomalus]
MGNFDPFIIYQFIISCNRYKCITYLQKNGKKCFMLTWPDIVPYVPENDCFDSNPY